MRVSGSKGVATGAATVLAIATALAVVDVAGAARSRPVIQRSDARPAAAGRVWPEPPERARIQFVGVLKPSEIRRSLLQRVWRVITGETGQRTLTQPYGVAVARDRLYVADTFGRAVYVFDLVKGGSEKIEVDADSLIGVAVIGTSLFVTDSATGRLLCLDLRGRRRWTLGPRDGLRRPTGIAAADDRLFVVDTTAHDVVVVSTDGHILERFGSNGSEPGQLNFPTNIIRGSDGRLYVTDSMNFRVQVFTPNGRIVTSFGRLGDASGDFNKPKGIALDSDGHVYVVEGLHDVVQIFSEEGRFLLAFGESGVGDGQFWLPSGITIANDVIYVSDSANRRIEVFRYLKETR